MRMLRCFLEEVLVSLIPFPGNMLTVRKEWHTSDLKSINRTLIVFNMWVVRIDCFVLTSWWRFISAYLFIVRYYPVETPLVWSVVNLRDNVLLGRTTTWARNKKDSGHSLYYRCHLGSRVVKLSVNSVEKLSISIVNKVPPPRCVELKSG